MLAGYITGSPGIVLSKIKATEPPTNMAVVRRTFNTWSISTMPEKKKEKQAISTVKAKYSETLHLLPKYNHCITYVVGMKSQWCQI